MMMMIRMSLLWNVTPRWPVADACIWVGSCAPCASYWNSDEFIRSTVQIQIPTYKKYQANFDSLAIRRDDIVRRRSCQKVANLLNFFDSLSLFCSLHLFQPSLAKNRKTWQNVTTFNLFMKISSSKKRISLWSQMNLIVVVRGVNVYVPTVCMSPVLFHCQRLRGGGGVREALILYKQGDTSQIRPTSTCNRPT